MKEQKCPLKYYEVCVYILFSHRQNPTFSELFFTTSRVVEIVLVPVVTPLVSVVLVFAVVFAFVVVVVLPAVAIAVSH